MTLPSIANYAVFQHFQPCFHGGNNLPFAARSGFVLGMDASTMW